MSLLDNLPAGRFIKWEAPGQFVTGTITALREKQATKFGTNDPDFWPNGDEKKLFEFTLATPERDGTPSDTGERRFDVNQWGEQMKSLRAGVNAFAATAGRKPDVGDAMTVAYVSGAGGVADPRQFRYDFAPGAGPLTTLDASQPVAPQPVAPQPVAPQPVAPQPVAAQTVAAQPVAAQPVAAGMNPADTARALLAQGLSVPDVAQATGLPPSTVAALAAAPQF